VSILVSNGSRYVPPAPVPAAPVPTLPPAPVTAPPSQPPSG
jgi:hypothetical protein